MDMDDVRIFEHPHDLNDRIRLADIGEEFIPQPFPFARTSHLIPHTYVVAANIPYYITGEIIRLFLEAERQPRAMALLIQKEVADRIVARDGKESILSLSVKVFGTPRIVSKVGKGNFNPPPQVDSAIILIEDISRKNLASRGDEKRFFEIVRAGFASKRKLLIRNLESVSSRESLSRTFDHLGISPKARAEDLRLPQWIALAAAL
jgi:16S rRNA (adenine1518-N6/adenine1519-N6)-dimethyltransferase